MNPSARSPQKMPRPLLGRKKKPVEKSLARQLYEAAEIVARVQAGESLTEGGLSGVAEVDRAAVQALVYGYLRSYVRHESVLVPLLKSPLKNHWVRALLGLATYRLEGWPDSQHTVVDQAVEAVSYVEEGRFKALVNGLLRNYLRQRDVLHHVLEHNAEVRWQHPLWWIERLKQDHPTHWEEILNAGNQHPPMGLRINSRRTTLATWIEQAQAAGIAVQPRGEEGVLVDEPVGVYALPGFLEGLVSVQDIGAQQAARMLEIKPGARVLDACAAPGGKTAHLLERCDAQVLALDISASRCERIHENLQRLGLSADVRCADCADLDSWWDGQVFDAVLADVPCSASGVARRFPDIKWLRQARDPEKFARTQRQILDNLSRVVAAGGQLLYASCSVFRVENQEQVQNFLRRHQDFHLIRECQYLPTVEHDGFYYALLTKEDVRHQ